MQLEISRERIGTKRDRHGLFAEQRSRAQPRGTNPSTRGIKPTGGKSGAQSPRLPPAAPARGKQPLDRWIFYGHAQERLIPLVPLPGWGHSTPKPTLGMGLHPPAPIFSEKTQQCQVRHPAGLNPCSLKGLDIPSKILDIPLKGFYIPSKGLDIPSKALHAPFPAQGLQESRPSSFLPRAGTHETFLPL